MNNRISQLLAFSFIFQEVQQAPLLLISATAANATLLFQLQRIDDSTVVLSGTGTTPFAGGVLRFSGVASTGNFGLDSHTGDLMMDGIGVDAVFIAVSSSALVVDFLGGWSPGATPSGSETIILDVETWVPVGSSGSIFDSVGVNVQGTWEMTSPVPEPTTLAIFGLGLAGLGFFMTRRRRVV